MTTILGEEWAPVKTWENKVEVSTYGRVRYVQNKQHLKQGWASVKKYACVWLGTRDGIQHREYIHRLVAETYIPNPENKRHIDHINNNPRDNRLTNLRWATPSDNMANAELKGTRGIRKSKNGTFFVRLRIMKQTIYGGSFATMEAATVRRNELYKTHYGVFCHKSLLVNA